MAKVPARARSSTGRTTDVKATTTPYHIPYNMNYRVPKQGFLLPGPDRPPAPAPARPVVGLPGPGVQAPAQGAPPAPGSAVIDWVNAHYAPALRQHVEQMLAANPQRAQQLMHPAAPAAPATQPPMPGLPAMPTGATAAPTTAAPTTPADPYANLPPDVASLLRGIDQQTQQEAAAIQSVNAAAIPAAQQFAAQLQQGLQGLVGQAGLNPITGAAPQDIPASVAALPYVMTQANQQQAMQQAAQAAGAAYDIPAQLQAAGAQNLAQFYGQAQQGVQSLAQDLIDQQMTRQTDLLKQQLVNAGGLAERQATGAATEEAARTRALATILGNVISSGNRIDVQNLKNALGLQVQGLKDTSATDVANIRAGATTQAASTRADATLGAAALRAKATAQKPLSSSTGKQIDAWWSGKPTKNPNPLAGTPAGDKQGIPAFVTPGAIRDMPLDKQGPELLQKLQTLQLTPAQMWSELKSHLNADQLRSLQYNNRTTSLARMGTFQRDLKQAQAILKRYYSVPGGPPSTSPDAALTALIPKLSKLIGLDGAEDLMMKSGFTLDQLEAWGQRNLPLIKQIQGG
jgi:hypothetical protein